MSAYRTDFDKTECMSFFIKDENMLERNLEKSQQRHQKRI